MPIDTSIYGAIQQPKPVNLLAQYANLMQVQGLQNQNALAQYTMKKAQREDEDNTALRADLAGGVDPYNALLNRGRVKEAGEWQKGQLAADADKFKLAKERHDVFQQTLGALSNEPNLSRDMVVQAGQSLVSQGILPKAIFEQAMAGLPEDPAQLRAKVMQSAKSRMTPEQIFTVFSAKPTEVSDGQRKFFKDTNPNSPTFGQMVGGAAVQLQASPEALLTDSRARSEGAANRSVTMRGQNLTDARAKEANGNAKAPAGYRWAADGKTLEPIPGGPAMKDKAPTEFQGKSATFGARAEEADKILTELTGKFSPAAVNSKTALGDVWVVGGALEAGANTMLSAESQKAEQAQRNFVNAVLRQESGAAIGKDEFANAKRQYFPQPGDSAAVIAQKAANRRTAIAGFKANAGHAALPSSASPVVPTSPTIDSLLDKYK